MFAILLSVALPVLLLGVETANLYLTGRVAQHGVDAIATVAARAATRGLQAKRFTLTNGQLDATATIAFAKQVAGASCSLVCMDGAWNCEPYIGIEIVYEPTTNRATVTSNIAPINCAARLLWSEAIQVHATATLPPIELPQ